MKPSKRRIRNPVTANRLHTRPLKAHRRAHFTPSLDKYFCIQTQRQVPDQTQYPRANPILVSYTVHISMQQPCSCSSLPDFSISKDRPGWSRSIYLSAPFQHYLTNSAQTLMPATANWVQSRGEASSEATCLSAELIPILDLAA